MSSNGGGGGGFILLESISFLLAAQAKTHLEPGESGKDWMLGILGEEGDDSRDEDGVGDRYPVVLLGDKEGQVAFSFLFSWGVTFGVGSVFSSSFLESSSIGLLGRQSLVFKVSLQRPSDPNSL